MKLLLKDLFLSASLINSVRQQNIWLIRLITIVTLIGLNLMLIASIGKCLIFNLYGFLLFVCVLFCISLFSLIFICKTDHILFGYIAVYEPLILLLTSDLYCISIGMYVEQRILFSQIVLILFIFIAGVIINPRHVIYVGTYSIIKMLFYAVVFKPPFIVDIFPYYITILVGIVVSFFIIIRTLYVFSYQSLVDSKLIDKKNKDLNQLINLKQDMISMILHDIRNSLNTILFASQENKLPTIVFNSVQHILQMADNFIDVHRMEENEVIIHPSNEFIKNTIYGAIEQVDYLLHEKNNWVKFYGVTSLQLNADHRLIERVFANILTNSIKHSLPNTPIEFRCEILSGHVRFEIINSGKPIHQDEVQSLFDKYVSNDQELKTNYNSKGLGLSFCKMVVQAHGGSIGFDTNYQKGVCIWFTLPDQNKYSSVTVVEQDLLSRLQLSPKEKKIIHPFSVRINQYEIYEISSIMQILDELTALDHPNIEYWKKELLNAILVWNKEYYDNLMAMVENSEADS